MIKTKFQRQAAVSVAREIIEALDGRYERIIVAGSLRRKREEVGDVEILYIPRIELVNALEDLLGQLVVTINRADQAIERLIREGFLSKRTNTLGREMWGVKNKLALHVQSGIPVDLFSATPDNWFNYLVCRTGSAENNIRLCQATERNGLKWNPYGSGFTRLSDGSEIAVQSEHDVFRIAGLDYLEPCQR